MADAPHAMRPTLPPAAEKIPAFSSPILWRAPARGRGSFVNSSRRRTPLLPSLCARRTPPPPYPIHRRPLRVPAAVAPPLRPPWRLRSLSSIEFSTAVRPRSSLSLPLSHLPLSLSALGALQARADPMAWGTRGGFLVALVVVLCSLSSSPVSSSSPEEEFVRKTVSSHEIVIFSKSYCPYCKRAKAVFKELDKVPYVVELDQRADGSDVQDALSGIVGRRTVPQVFIHGKHIGGSDDTVEAYQSGRLAKLLGIESKDDL